MLKIEKKVPLPVLRKKGPTKFPWLEMQVGDSFFVPEGNLVNLRSNASRASGVYQKTFTARAVEGGVRVWRVK
jgi:hypothetical protein